MDAADPRAKALSTRFDKAKMRRSDMEDLLDDCYTYALPGRKGFRNTTPGSGMDEIYDHTATVALEDFAGMVHARVTPPHTAWVSLEANGKVAAEDRASVNRDLEEIRDFMFEEIHSSNFGTEAQEGFLDMGCSLGCMLVEDRNGQLLHATPPLTQVYVDAGVDDTVGSLFREREITAELIPVQYPDAEIGKDLERLITDEWDKPLVVVDGMWLVPEPGSTKTKETVMVRGGSAATQHVIRDRTHEGWGSKPFVAYRWSKAAGEIWGRGPIMKVLPGVRTTQLVMEMVLQNAAMALSGMYHIDDDGVVNAYTIEIRPGALIPRSTMSRGLERIDTGGREFNVGQIVLEDQRRDIHNATFSNTLGDPEKTPFKATEAAARMQLQAERISANFGRMRHEFVAPYIRRVLWLLQKRRDIKLPVPIDMIRIEPNGPLARAIKQRVMQDIMAYLQYRISVYGPQFAMATVDEPNLDALMRDVLGVPANVRASPQKITQNMQQMAAMAQAAQSVQAA